MLIAGAIPVAAEQVFPKGDFFLYSGRIPKVQNADQLYTAFRYMRSATSAYRDYIKLGAWGIWAKPMLKYPRQRTLA